MKKFILLYKWRPLGDNWESDWRVYASFKEATTALESIELRKFPQYEAHIFKVKACQGF